MTIKNWVDTLAPDALAPQHFDLRSVVFRRLELAYPEPNAAQLSVWTYILPDGRTKGILNVQGRGPWNGRDRVLEAN